MEQPIPFTSIYPGLFSPVSGAWPYYLFERESSTQNNTLVLDKENEALDHGKAVRCAWCKTVITYQGNAEHIQGRHVHTFVNPGGYEFTLGCFRSAWCKVMGPVMLEWSWFAGYTWQYALCPQCQAHLGWFYHFSVEDSSFYGLILDRLISDSSGGDTD